MNFSNIYKKTSKGSRAPKKGLPQKTRKVLSAIDKKQSAGAIYASLDRIKQNDFEYAISWLLENSFIELVSEEPFPNTVWDAAHPDAIDVAEISEDEFSHFDQDAENQAREKEKQEEKKAAEREAAKRAVEKAEVKAREQEKAAAKKEEKEKRAEEKRKQKEEKEKQAAAKEAEKRAMERAEAKVKELENEAKAREEAEQIKRDEAARLRAEKEAKKEKERKQKAVAEKVLQEKERESAIKKPKEATENQGAEGVFSVTKPIDIEDVSAEIAQTNKETRQRAKAMEETGLTSTEEGSPTTAPQKHAIKTRLTSFMLSLLSAMQSTGGFIEQQVAHLSRPFKKKISIEKSRRKVEAPIATGVFKALSLLSLTIVILAVLAAQFLNLRVFIQPLESFITLSIKEKVTIESVRAPLFPSPRLALKNLKVGTNVITEIDEVIVFPTISELYGYFNQDPDKPYDIPLITINGLAITQQNVANLPVWLNSSAQHKQLKIHAIKLADTDVSLKQVAIKNVSANIKLDTKGLFREATVQNEKKTLTANIEKVVSRYAINLQGERWEAPYIYNALFNKVYSTGNLENGQLVLDPINAELYGGSLDATMSINLAENKVNGTFDIKNASLKSAAIDLKYDDLVNGKMLANGTFSFDLNAAVPVYDSLKLNAKFHIKNGYLNKADIAQAIMRNNIRGSTHFSDLSGHIALNKKRIKLTKLLLKENQLVSSGALYISESNKLSGALSSTITVNKKVIRSRLKLSGTPNSIRLVN